MKKLILCGALLVAGCTTTTTTTTTQTTQQDYVQACAVYSGAFAVVLALREAGKLNQVQIDQVTLIDSQVTPLCTGTLPADTDVAAAKITAAITTLTILETVQ
jgi:hypothetical protein